MTHDNQTYRDKLQLLLDDAARYQATPDECCCAQFVSHGFSCDHTEMLKRTRHLWRAVVVESAGIRVGNRYIPQSADRIIYRVNDHALASHVLRMTERRLAAQRNFPEIALEDVQEPDHAMSTDGGDFYPGERTAWPSAERKAALAAAAARVNVTSVTDTRGHWLEI